MRYTVHIDDREASGITGNDAKGNGGSTKREPKTALAERLTGSIRSMPSEHAGGSPFSFEVHLSVNPKLGYKTVRDRLLSVGTPRSPGQDA